MLPVLPETGNVWEIHQTLPEDILALDTSFSIRFKRSFFDIFLRCAYHLRTVSRQPLPTVKYLWSARAGYRYDSMHFPGICPILVFSPEERRKAGMPFRLHPLRKCICICKSQVSFIISRIDIGLEVNDMILFQITRLWQFSSRFSPAGQVHWSSFCQI